MAEPTKEIRFVVEINEGSGWQRHRWNAIHDNKPDAIRAADAYAEANDKHVARVVRTLTTVKRRTVWCSSLEQVPAAVEEGGAK